jgi:hypothetical protein
MRALSAVCAFLAATLAMQLALAPTELHAQRRRGRDTARQQPAAQPTRLVFDMLPDGAEVLVDEATVGVGPLGPVDTTPGEHTVRVRLQGFTEYTDVVNIERGQELHVPVDLIPLEIGRASCRERVS